MILVEGVLSGIGSGITNPFTNWRNVEYIEFSDRDDIRSSVRRISFTPYHYDKLSGALGQKIKLAMTDNYVVAAIKVDNKIYSIDNSNDLKTARKNSLSGLEKMIDILLFASIFAGILPSIAVIYFLNKSRNNKILALANRL
jgi:hypothetical protein